MKPFPQTPSLNPGRAAELSGLGYAAFRRGNLARARQHFARAVALLGTEQPARWTALSDLGATCAAMGDFPAAAEAHQAALHARRAALGDTHQDVAVSLHNLAATKRALGDAATAHTLQTEALSIWQAGLGATHALVAKAHASLSALARDRGDTPAALAHARQTLAIHQQSPGTDDTQIAAAHDDLAQALLLAGDRDAAETHWRAAMTMLQRRPAPGRIALLWHRIGTARRLAGDLRAAAAAFTAALAADATLTAARHSLAAVLTRLGDSAQARTHRDLALRQQSIFVQDGPLGSPRILILSLSDDGNIPLDHLVPEAAYTRIWWFIAHAPDASPAALPPYDIVFNAIGDPDMAGPAEAGLASFLASNIKPVLNDPARVRLTRRDLLPETLAGIDGLSTPPVCRIGAGATPARIADEAGRVGIDLPALIRPAGAHGGAGLLRIDDWTALDATALHAHPAWYVSTFHDLRAPDGLVRKYRAIFVNGAVLPYHLAISPHWMVHYYTAGMADHPAKLAEEAAFLNDPAASIGARGMAALHAAAARIGLDYCGIDFALRADGQMLVFEANPTMLIHPEPETGPLSFKNPAVARIVAALHARLHPT